MTNLHPTQQPDSDQNDRKAFWRAYLAWLAQASEQELEELVAVLTANLTAEVRPLVSALRDAMCRETNRRDLPPGLVQQLEAASWPAAQAIE